MSAPVLISALDADSILWTWADANPDHFQVDESADGVSGWTLQDTVDGTDRESFAVPPLGVFVRISARDASDVLIGEYSNVLPVSP